MKKSEGREKGSNDLAELAFTAQQQFIGLTQNKPSDAVDNAVIYPTVSLQFIVNTLLHKSSSHLTDNGTLLQAVAKSARVREQYEYVLKQIAAFSSTHVRAASSTETLQRRQAKGFSIDLSDDPEMPEQAHVLLQLESDFLNNDSLVDDSLVDKNDNSKLEATNNNQTSEYSKLVIHLGWKNAFYQLVFNHAFEQQQKMFFQTILSKTSPEYSAIVDLDSRIYLTFLGK